MTETNEFRGLTTEQLADAGAARADRDREQVADGPATSDTMPAPAGSPAQQAATDPWEQDAGGMPVAPDTDGAAARSDQPGDIPDPGSSAGTAREAEAAQLLEADDRSAMTQRWRDIQADFVDSPRQAMQDADALVAGLMQRLAQTFAQERANLEGQWSRGDLVSTEDLRVSLQRYRAFFERLLSV